MKECLYEKLKWAREAKYRQDHHGSWDPGRITTTTPALGPSVLACPRGRGRSRTRMEATGDTAPDWAGDFPITGRDAALFTTKWPGVADTVRPLPAGEYKFYYAYRPKEFVYATVFPNWNRNERRCSSPSLPPAGAVHEAFFDLCHRVRAWAPTHPTACWPLRLSRLAVRTRRSSL